MHESLVAKPYKDSRPFCVPPLQSGFSLLTHPPFIAQLIFAALASNFTLVAFIGHGYLASENIVNMTACNE